MGSTTGLATDARSLDNLKRDASKDPASAVRKVAAQFEAVFMQSLIKSMRDTVPKSGLTGSSSATETYTGMLDSQLAQSMSGRKGGIADVIARQLSKSMGLNPDAAAGANASAKTVGGVTMGNALGLGASGDAAGADGTSSIAALGALSGDTGDASIQGVNRALVGARQAAAAAAAAAAAEKAAPAIDPDSVSSSQSGFVQSVWRHAVAAQSATGVPAHYVVGQAALESGWGKREIKMPDGSSSHNVFGIKATADWKGKTVDVTTTEYVGGSPRSVVQTFKAYDSYASAFKDWAGLIGGKARYSDVMRSSGNVSDYAHGMQKAGYATDPKYGDKLEKTINKALAIKRLVV